MNLKGPTDSGFVRWRGAADPEGPWPNAASLANNLRVTIFPDRSAAECRPILALISEAFSGRPLPLTWSGTGPGLVSGPVIGLGMLMPAPDDQL